MTLTGTPPSSVVAGKPGSPPKNSRLGVFGAVLAVLLPPVGLILSIIALRTIRKNRLGGKSNAIFGIMWGAVFTVPFLFVAWLIIVTGHNKARSDVRPLISQVQAAGGTKLCDNGDSGFGPDNTEPWYEAYYQLHDSSRLTSQIKQYAAQLGYPLAVDTGYIEQLNNTDGTNTIPPDTPPLSAMNDYLIDVKPGGGTLRITVYRNTAVPLNCGVENYGQKHPTGNGNAIIDIQFSLPSRA